MIIIIAFFFRVKIVKEIVFVNFKTVPTIYWVETQFQWHMTNVK